MDLTHAYCIYHVKQWASITRALRLTLCRYTERIWDNIWSSTPIWECLKEEKGTHEKI